MRFNDPFNYTPWPPVKRAAESLIRKIHSMPSLDAIFGEGKMMGVLIVAPEGTDISKIEGDSLPEGFEVLYGFSGLVGNKAFVEGFVPPIFDYSIPGGYYREEEARITALNVALRSGALSEDERESARQERKNRSIALQQWLFDQYRVSNGKGETKTISEVFAERGLVPPGGTGDCALPRLLQYAYSNKLVPVASGEFWYGASPLNHPRTEGEFYPSCTNKCGPLLAFMLENLLIIN